MIDLSKPSLDAALLAHYGVKGMKWGTRKGRVTFSDKRAAKKNVKAAGKVIMAERFKDQSITALEYSKLSTKKVVIKEGQEFVRITARGDEKLQDKTYLSYRPEDRETYRATMPQLAGGKKHYEYAYKATKALSGPSEKARVDAFIDLLDKPSVNVGNRTMTGKEFLAWSGYTRSVKTLETQQLGLKFYRDELLTGVMKNNPLGSAYVKNLRDKGYNMLTDDMDRGILSKEPLIVLDPEGSIKRIQVKRLTKKDMNDAQKNFVTEAQRKKA